MAHMTYEVGEHQETTVNHSGIPSPAGERRQADCKSK